MLDINTSFQLKSCTHLNTGFVCWEGKFNEIQYIAMKVFVWENQRQKMCCIVPHV